MFRTWLPPNERNSAEGIKAASARLGAAIVPALMAYLYSYFTWRQVFVLFGIVGVIWAIAFHRWYRDDPRLHPDVNAGERTLLPPPSRESHSSVKWSRLLRSRSVWALGIQWFCHYYGFYFYITWLPLYLYQSRGLNLRSGAVAAGLPLFAAGLGSLAAGWTLSALVKRMNSTVRARRLLGYAAYGGAAILLVAFMRVENPLLAMLVLSLSSFAAEFSGPITWTTAMDIGGERVGTVSGFMNMLGHLGGAVAPSVTGMLLAWSGNAWNAAFLISALIYAAGAVCWRYIDDQPIDC
jgi:sugar phosphate permease